MEHFSDLQIALALFGVFALILAPFELGQFLAERKRKL